MSQKVVTTLVGSSRKRRIKSFLINPSNHYRLSFFNAYYVVQNNFQQTWEARRERLKSALYLRLKKRRFEIYVGRLHEKLLFSDLRLLLTKTQYSSDKVFEKR